MDSLCPVISPRERGAALIIVLSLVVLLTGLMVAYVSRTTSDRQVAHSSFNQSKADQLAASAMDNIIGGLRQEITGPSPTPTPPYLPATNANMLPMRSGTPSPTPLPGPPDPIPNLVRRSLRFNNPGELNAMPSPRVPSLPSAVNSTTATPPHGR